MTRESANKWWDVIVAFKEGKEIQVKNSAGIWEDISDTVFNKDRQYRVKPSPKPRPYKSIEEFKKDMKKHGPNIKNPNYSTEYLPLMYTPEGIHTAIESISYKHLLEYYEWEDGSPCGIMVKDE